MNELRAYEIENLHPDMTATFGKTITEADIVLFAGVSGDNTSMDINEEFAQQARKRAINTNNDSLRAHHYLSHFIAMVVKIAADGFTKPLLSILLAFGFTLGPLTTPASAQSRFDLAAQLTLLMQWWPGEYDNHEQIVRQAGGGLSPLTDSPFYRLHTVVVRAALPALGVNVLRATEYRDGDASKIVRDRIYVLKIDEQTASIRVSQFSATTVSTDTLSNMATQPLGTACDLTMRFIGGQFEGAANGDCRQSGISAAHKVVVGPQYVWVHGGGTIDGWFQQTRAKFFTCTVHESANGVMRETRYLTTIRLHDQGGEADIAWPDGRTLTFTIHSRAFTMPAEREYPLFRIHEKGKLVPIAYAYAVDGATRFGLNLGWFYIRCYADGDWDPSEDLRK